MLQLNETTVEDLQKTLTTDAWKDLSNKDSAIHKLVTHTVFEEKEGRINVDKLILFGILHCRGNVKDKAEALFGVFQYGGSARYDSLIRHDEDIETSINTLQ